MWEKDKNTKWAHDGFEELIKNDTAPPRMVCPLLESLSPCSVSFPRLSLVLLHFVAPQRSCFTFHTERRLIPTARNLVRGMCGVLTAGRRVAAAGAAEQWLAGAADEGVTCMPPTLHMAQTRPAHGHRTSCSTRTPPVRTTSCPRTQLITIQWGQLTLVHQAGGRGAGRQAAAARVEGLW